MDALLFITFASIAVLCAINLVLQTHPIASALSLVGVMLSLGVLYLLLGGEFIAAVQVIVYAGAIMVLFVFVIMLLNAGAEKKIIREKPLMATVVGLPVLFGFAGLMAWIIQSRLPFTDPVKFGAFTGGTARDVGGYIFRQGLLPFEVTSVLILVAIMGALVLAQKEID